jgi:hypothetical protein
MGAETTDSCVIHGASEEELTKIRAEMERREQEEERDA